MFYVLEPQRDMNAEHHFVNGDDGTYFCPCPVGEATIFAVFTRERRDDPNEDPEYIGDVSVPDVLELIRKAEGSRIGLTNPL